MDRIVYQRRLQEALSKAFAARAPNVREAYFDLANFYHRKLGGQCHAFPSHEELRQCLAARNRAN